MENDDERNKRDKEDPTTTTIDQSSFTIAKADSGYGSRRHDPTPNTTATADRGYGSRRDDSTPDTIATGDHGYGSRRDDPTPETIAPADRGYSSRRDYPTPETITTADRGYGSQRDDPTPETIATADGGNSSQRDEPMPDTIATADHGYGSQRDDPTPETIATADGGNGSQRDEPVPDTIATFDSGHGRDALDDKSVGKLREGCVMQVNSEMIQQHQQTDMRLTLTGDGPTVVGKHSTVIYNVSGPKRKHDTTESSGCRDNPSSKRPNYETKTISEYGCSSSGVSETLDDGDNSIIYDCKSNYMDTSDCSGYSSGTKPNLDAKPILEHGSSSFTDRVTPNITEKFEGGSCNTRYIHAEGTHLKNVREDSAVSEFRQ
ncbi:uncharacterized protein LOC117318654, partial [Pecten maximus]|uniref:uncharacterized protein LOC117318654 n=1 Tax=Pecten maximus TaxID=6579 RepID=UPI001458D714